jgi:putative oxidoreductase
VNRTLPEPTRDLALLVARLLLGTIMFAHGYQKLMIDGLGRTTQGFESMSIPVAIVSAAFVTVIEVVGGVLVILGALLTVVAAFYLVVMVGAAVFVHIPNGVFVQNNGWELVGAIAALLLALAAAGSGRFGVDHLIRSRQSPAVAPAPAPAPAAVPPVPAWPSRPVGRHDHSGRATAFTEVFPQVSTDVPAVPLPVRRPRHTQASSAPTSPPPSSHAPSSPIPSSPIPSSPIPSSPPPASHAPSSPTPSSSAPSSSAHAQSAHSPSPTPHPTPDRES